jgi:hypothetical protein
LTDGDITVSVEYVVSAKIPIVTACCRKTLLIINVLARIEDDMLEATAMIKDR